VREDDRTVDDEAGDAVCWLTRVCDRCGALADGPAPAVCPRCGHERDADADRPVDPTA